MKNIENILKSKDNTSENGDNGYYGYVERFKNEKTKKNYSTPFYPASCFYKFKK
jgi:hypothetical protein